MKIRFKRILAVFATIVSVTIGPTLAYLFWCTQVTEGSPVSSSRSVDETENRLKEHVRFLAQPRSESHREHYVASENFIRETLESIGWVVHSENVPGIETSSVNLWVEAGTGDQLVIFGAHYDSAYDTPGADDNASGVAVALELARHLKTLAPKNRVVIAFFANEEQPHFRTDRMGSFVMAKRLVEAKQNICVMVSLEMLGYFDSEPGSQKYPLVLSWFYPDTGDFIGVVGNTDGRGLVKTTTSAFHRSSSLRAFGFAGPMWIKGLDYSDHLPFWNEGVDAIMVTDTSFFRNPHYHQKTDLWQTLDFASMAQVVLGLESVLADFADRSACNVFND